MHKKSELDHPVWASLTGPQDGFAVQHGGAVRYQSDVSSFAAVADHADPQCWSDLAEMIDHDRVAVVHDPSVTIPASWSVTQSLHVLQMVDRSGRRPSRGSDTTDLLAAEDVPDMLELVRLTKPGPFLRRTITLGEYRGIHSEAQPAELVAMAGQRIFTGQWREISGVCTSPRFQGRGLARRLVGAVTDQAAHRGERAFLHVTAGNPAIPLYASMGFEIRRTLVISVVLRRLASE